MWRRIENQDDLKINLLFYRLLCLSEPIRTFNEYCRKRNLHSNAYRIRLNVLLINADEEP